MANGTIMSPLSNEVLAERLSGIERQVRANHDALLLHVKTIEIARKDQTEAHAEAHAALHAAAAKSAQDVAQSAKDTRDTLQSDVKAQALVVSANLDRQSAEVSKRLDKVEVALIELQRWASNIQGRFLILGVGVSLISVVVSIAFALARGGGVT